MLKAEPQQMGRLLAWTSSRARKTRKRIPRGEERCGEGLDGICRILAEPLGINTGAKGWRARRLQSSECFITTVCETSFKTPYFTKLPKSRLERTIQARLRYLHRFSTPHPTISLLFTFLSYNNPTQIILSKCLLYLNQTLPLLFLLRQSQFRLARPIVQSGDPLLGSFAAALPRRRIKPIFIVLIVPIQR